jgi:hypothetical protein
MNVTQLAFSTLEFNRVHGVMHPDGWEHPLHLEASQLFVSILLRQGPLFGDLCRGCGRLCPSLIHDLV